MNAARRESQQVSWFEVHLFVESLVAQANCGPLPWPGTPAWCEMDDLDPRKLLAVAQFGVHFALRVETCQQAHAAASRAISAADDWSAVARGIRRHNDAISSGAYIRREGHVA
jgi:hypothetical protein